MQNINPHDICSSHKSFREFLLERIQSAFSDFIYALKYFPLSLKKIFVERGRRGTREINHCALRLCTVYSILLHPLRIRAHALFSQSFFKDNEEYLRGVKISQIEGGHF